MPLVFGCVAPHGGELIPKLAGKDLRKFGPTRIGMKTLATELSESKPGTIVVASPHNLRLLRHIGVVLSENTTGELREGRNSVKLKARCDVEFGRRVLERAEKAGLPVVGANYGGLEGVLSDLAMDWGTLVPLWFFRSELKESRVLIVTPSRGIPLKQNFEFGRAVAEEAESSRSRVAFVASADQAHAHRRDGPYGFSPRAAEYDSVARDAVAGGLEAVLGIDPEMVEEAKPDSLWQMAMLAGALSVVPMESRLVLLHFLVPPISYQRSAP